MSSVIPLLIYCCVKFIIICFKLLSKSHTTEKHVNFETGLCAFPESFVKHFFGNISAEAGALVVSRRRGWVSVLPLFKFVYLTHISMETRPTSELTLGLPIRGMNRKIEIAKILI